VVPTPPVWRSNLLLLIGAALWGSTFVPQRLAAEFLGPFSYNAARFALGALVVLPFALARRPSRGGEGFAGVATGLALAAAATLQQAGMAYTTAGKAGFVTGLYVAIVPVFALAFGRRSSGLVWLGVLLCVIGLHALCVPPEGFPAVNRGDWLVLGSAFCWAVQILLLDHLSPGRDPFRISCIQNAVCALASLLCALAWESSTLADWRAAAGYILYAGIFSAGIAFTLQVVAQRHSPPGHVAVLMSLEAVFAALVGWAWLDERLDGRAAFGAALLLGGTLLAQADALRVQKPTD
jgi:drug/metabolite transporter (DMT)-like permease